jgi:hypothetical protein
MLISSIPISPTKKCKLKKSITNKGLESDKFSKKRKKLPKSYQGLRKGFLAVFRQKNYQQMDKFGQPNFPEGEEEFCLTSESNHTNSSDLDVNEDGNIEKLLNTCVMYNSSDNQKQNS